MRMECRERRIPERRKIKEEIEEEGAKGGPVKEDK